jgi:hypothetical protein
MLTATQRVTTATTYDSTSYQTVSIINNNNNNINENKNKNKEKEKENGRSTGV